MRAWLPAFAALWIASPAAAQASDLAPGDVCVSIAHIWDGSPNDIAEIARTPIPASFRKSSAKTGCERSQLIDDSLINWHLRFGTEATTTAALRFLADDYQRRAELPRSKPDRWLDLALTAVRAGELYRSPGLLALVDRYAIRAAASAPPGASAYNDERKTWLVLRRAALRALVTRSPRDVEAAREVLHAHSTPALEALRHSSPRDVICGDGPADFDRAVVKPACDTINNFDRLALVYWEARARVALASVDPTDCAVDRSPSEVESALALLTAQRDSDEVGSDWPDYVPERIVALLLAAADVTAPQACPNGVERRDARDALLRAERLTPIATAPTPYRMIAERFLALPGQLDDRWAATFRTTLTHLDEITAATKRR